MPEVVVWQWAAFSAIVAVLLLLDLLVFHRHDHAPTLRESVGWTVFWIGVALAFNGLVWWWRGPEQALAFLSGYVVEKALSMDNVFVFAVIFGFFRVPLMYQHRVLYWGILGAIFLRLAFVLAGVQLIQHFEWVLPLFGLLLIYTAIRLAMHADSEVHPEKNPMLILARRFLRISRGDHHQHGHAFFAREGGLLCITPLFLVLIVVESSDVVFAVDSIPAIFGITTDPFIIFTSNIFAILGLRALYFVLAGVIEMFRYLHYGLSAVLGFIGLIMVGDWWFGAKLLPTWAKLLVIAVLLVVSVIASLAVGKKENDE